MGALTRTYRKSLPNTNRATSRTFEIGSGVTQGCVLAPTLFGIFFSMMLSLPLFHSRRMSTYTQELTERCRHLLKPKTKVHRVRVREMLFADDAALATHTEEHLQKLMDIFFFHVCREFGLTIYIKKTNVNDKVPRSGNDTMSRRR